ncbi:hypothetical protein NW761_004296 [Fusarium oxysporum]|nr:hypothetical protein NW758_005058 [Fusarium oxysporum]KAJ4098159.1 hypothetical protein NW761_004296 [Fusarium oxysporum]
MGHRNRPLSLNSESANPSIAKNAGAPSYDAIASSHAPPVDVADARPAAATGSLPSTLCQPKLPVYPVLPSRRRLSRAAEWRTCPPWDQAEPVLRSRCFKHVLEKRLNHLYIHTGKRCSRDQPRNVVVVIPHRLFHSLRAYQFKKSWSYFRPGPAATI